MRNEQIKAGITPEMKEKGRLLLNQLQKTYRSHLWAKKKLMAVTYANEWPGFFSRTIAMPWHKNRQQVRFEKVLSFTQCAYRIAEAMVVAFAGDDTLSRLPSRRWHSRRAPAIGGRRVWRHGCGAPSGIQVGAVFRFFRHAPFISGCTTKMV